MELPSGGRERRIRPALDNEADDAGQALLRALELAVQVSRLSCP